MEEKAKKIAELLKLLANEHRLLILCALIQGPLTVGEVHSLVQLKTAGILDSEKRGMNVFYRIQDERVIGMIAFLKEHYCK